MVLGISFLDPFGALCIINSRNPKPCDSGFGKESWELKESAALALGAVAPAALPPSRIQGSGLQWGPKP